MSHLLFPSSTALLEIHSSSVRGENTHSPALSPSKAALKAEAMIESPDPRRSRSFSRFPLELCAPSPAATQTRGRVADELGEAAAELTCGAPPTASSRWPFSRLSRACVCLFADATFGNFFGRQKVPLAIFRGYNPPTITATSTSCCSGGFFGKWNCSPKWWGGPRGDAQHFADCWS